MIRKNRPQNVVIDLGHLNRIRSNQRSTDPHGSTRAPHKGGPAPIRLVAKIELLEGQHYQDLAVRFPFISRRGFQYFLTTYDEHSGYVHVTLLKSRNAEELKCAFHADLLFWQSYQRHPEFTMMDNEAPQELVNFLQGEGVTMQLAPPNNHPAKKAERMIGYWKDHFVATTCIVPKEFLLQDWD